MPATTTDLRLLRRHQPDHAAERPPRRPGLQRLPQHEQLGRRHSETESRGGGRDGHPGCHRGRCSVASANSANPAPVVNSARAANATLAVNAALANSTLASSAASAAPAGTPRAATLSHAGVTSNCVSCHNGVLATGKGPTHIASNNACQNCHRPSPGCRRASITRASRQSAPAAITAWWHRAGQHNTCRRLKTAEPAMARSHGMWRPSATSESAPHAAAATTASLPSASRYSM